MPPKMTNDTTMEMVMAVKALAQSMDYVHSSLRQLLEREGADRSHDHDQLLDLVGQIQRQLAVLPHQLGDRTEVLLDRKLAQPLDEFRRSLDSLRMEVWKAVGQPRGVDASGSGMTVVDGVPTPLEDKPSASIALTPEGMVKMTGQVDGAKVVRVAKWVIATIAAGGGVAAFVRAVADALR